MNWPRASSTTCARSASVLIEGKHYFRPFGGRKILFLWENIERDMVGVGVAESRTAIPMANGGVLHG